MAPSGIDTIDDLVTAFADHHARAAELAMIIASYADTGEWAVDGSLSMAAWMREHLNIAHRDALAWLRHGRFLRRYPAIATAATSATLGPSHVNAIRANVTHPTAALLDEMQHGLVDALTPLSATDAAVACAAWRAKAEALVPMPEPKLREREWVAKRLDDGTLVGRFVLTADDAAQLDAALDTARRWEGTDDTRTPKRRDADAIVDVLAFFNANHDRPGTPRNRPHVELIIHADQLADPHNLLATTIDARPVPTADAALCDCVLHRVLTADATPLDYGRGQRTVPRDLFRAVAMRDGGCRFPGCDRKVAWCDAHHVLWWRRHGDTKLDNLLLLCNRHHHIVHQQTWDIVLRDDGHCTFTNTATNTTRTSQPRGLTRPPPRHLQLVH